MNKLSHILALSAACLLGVMPLKATDIKRAEPLSWWVGMKTPLQIMFNGDNIGNCQVSVKGLDIKKVHKADSPNYLFVDVEIPANAKPGTYTFEFTNGNEVTKFNYQIDKRRDGSAQRIGFNSSDMMYLIMPDRFSNGDPSNDVTENTLEKADRSNHNSRHGGDLQGIINHLDYLQAMGVTAVWNTPLLEDNEPRTTYHGYSCSDYYHIDPRYGSNEIFKEFVEQAHQHGIKIVMDVVTNHCGTAHWWMKDLPFKDWVHPYTRNSGSMSMISDPNAAQIDKNLFLDAWFAPSMPDMNMDNPFVLRYFTQWAVWWVECSNLDSFRVDTYPYNSKEPSSQWCANVRAEYPNISIVGECWQGSPHYVAYWDGNHTNYDGYCSHLTSVMDFPMMNALGGLRPPQPQPQDAQNAQQPQRNMRRGGATDAIYNVLTQDFVYPKPSTLLLFAANHDTNRISDNLDGDVDRSKLTMTLLATLRGIPQLYYGDEMLLRRATDEERPSDGGKRVDFPGGWKEDAVNLFKAENRTTQQQDLYTHISKLFNWRKTADVIHNGKTMQFKPQNDVYVYFRYNDKDKVMVVVNASSEKATLDWARFAEITQGLTQGKDIISNATVTVGTPFEIPAVSSAVIDFN